MILLAEYQFDLTLLMFLCVQFYKVRPRVYGTKEEKSEGV